jgi:hypothetical protein
MPNLTAADLDGLFKQAEQVDNQIFSEMRSNVLLTSGDHYNKLGSKFWNRIRSSENLTKQEKIRLTKNHTQYIINHYMMQMLSFGPGVAFLPNNKSEIQDQKTAELNKEVFDGIDKQIKFRELKRELAKDFVTFGEVCTITYFDPDAGDVKGYGPLIEDGEPVLSPEGELVPDENDPVMSGKFRVERIYPFNLLRAHDVTSMEESPYLIRRRMVEKKEAKRLSPPDMWEKVSSRGEETYMVFDGDTGSYYRSNNKVMIREHYYRPSKEYPNGFYYLCMNDLILKEGELPNGIWPIAWQGWDRIPTSCRARSPIKQIRPYQLEINRAASSMATAQITLGDDKLILPHGAKVTQGSTLPGVRAMSVKGSVGDVKILPGRSGEQYLGYMQQQIQELYHVMNVTEPDFVKSEKGLDPYSLLYKSIRDRERFSQYGEKFQEFIIDNVTILMDLARFYLEQDDLVNYIGRSEIPNISEFKHSEPNRFRITVEAKADDAETLLGKKLAFDHTLQYVGRQLSKEDIGKILRATPYTNDEEAFDDFVIDYDNAKNDILALERGDYPKVYKYDEHVYMIKALSSRMRKPDFKYLSPEIQKNFAKKLQEHERAEAQRILEVQRAQSGFIPTEGYLVTCDFYVSDEKGKNRRVRLPYSSVKWLIEQLEAQGQTLAQLEAMGGGAREDISRIVAEGKPGKRIQQGEIDADIQRSGRAGQPIGAGVGGQSESSRGATSTGTGGGTVY